MAPEARERPTPETPRSRDVELEIEERRTVREDEPTTTTERTRASSPDGEGAHQRRAATDPGPRTARTPVGNLLSGPVGVSLMSASGTDKALLALARELTE